MVGAYWQTFISLYTCLSLSLDIFTENFDLQSYKFKFINRIMYKDVKWIIRYGIKNTRTLFSFGG